MSSYKRVTIKDVARVAGVSTGTASRVINMGEGDIKISKATRNKVSEAARQLDYRPNPFASALRTHRTGMIGVIIRDICDPFLIFLAREIQKAGRRKGMDLLFAHAEYDLGLVGHHIAFMHSHLFDGLLLLGDIPGDLAIIDELSRSNTPFVAVARGLATKLTMVNVDEKKGIELGIEYLQSLGHERIAFIGNMVHGGVKERSTHFRQYFQEHSLTLDDKYLQLCGNNRRDAIICSQNLLSLPNPPTAIFCATDLAAYSAITATYRMNLKIPENVSILGFDDIEGSADVFPALTTIRQPIDEMASKSIDLLMALIVGGAADNSKTTRVLVEPRLIVRQSCGAPQIEEKD